MDKLQKIISYLPGVDEKNLAGTERTATEAAGRDRAWILEEMERIAIQGPFCGYSQQLND